MSDQTYPTVWAYEQACIALATCKAEIARLREALRFYANGEHYDDWHDTGRTERQTSPVPAERWVNDGSGKYEYAGWDYEDQEFDAPVWESTVSEDHGRVAREALEAGER